jgi:hypothetical protein
MSEFQSETQPIVWILVDHSAREESFRAVADILKEQGAQAEILTITEVIGSAARGAITGGAERLLRGLRVAIQGKSDEDFLGAVRRARPDVLAITDARFVRALGLVDTLTGIGALQVGVLPDYNLSADWLKSSVQAFIVPHESFRERLSKRGIDATRVIVAGPPIQPRFAQDQDRDAIRKEFKFAADQHVVLVRADGIDAAWLDKVVFQATLVESKVKFVFHHNGDGATAATLRRAAQQYGLRALMFGHVPDLQKYISASDLVIAASREPLIAEIVALDRPVLFVGDAGAGSDQVEFLVREKAARHVSDLLRLGTEIDGFLESATLEVARAAAAAISAKNGSRDVADALLVATKHRHEWAVKTPVTPSDEGGPDEEPAPAGAFEEIGAQPDRNGAASPDYSGIGMAEARDQLARLILDEREIEKRLDEATKQQERWRGRLNLAREWNETDLAAEAEALVRSHIGEVEILVKDLAGIRQQKVRLKVAAHGGKPGETQSETNASPDVENRFRKMEADSDLKGLKDRIRRELGE